jgi:hypothetical protein
MRFRLTTAVVSLALIAFAGSAFAADTEQDIVNRYLKKTAKKHVRHTGWFNMQAQYNRLSRSTDYNKFDSYLNTQMTGGQFAGQYNAKSLGADLGMMLSKRIGWSLGGEYWLKNSEKVTGSVQYTPVGGSPTTITNPNSEISVIGAYTGVQYYVVNPPMPTQPMKGVSAWIGATAGYYSVKWNMFPQYQNLNLSTSAPDGANATFKGNAPGFSVNFGLEYPIIPGLTFGADANYLYLNFSNVAWYNTTNQEVVASYDGTKEGRVDLAFTGLRGKLSLRKYFSW